MKLLGPELTLLHRQVEQRLVAAIAQLEFAEIMLPRLIPLDEWYSVVGTLGPISEELDTELFRVIGKHDREPTHALCHWQCEPFYLALNSEAASLPDRVFDRSGWSYRNEPVRGEFKHRQFQRIECILKGSPVDVRGAFDATFQGLRETVETLIGPLDVYCPVSEKLNSPQLEVRDAVWRSGDTEVEIIGAHRHGAAFVQKFMPAHPGILQTACIGVSVSRIAAILARDIDAKARLK